jgi:hypothetical protein
MNDLVPIIEWNSDYVDNPMILLSGNPKLTYRMVTRKILKKLNEIYDYIFVLIITKRPDMWSYMKNENQCVTIKEVCDDSDVSAIINYAMNMYVMRADIVNSLIIFDEVDTEITGPAYDILNTSHHYGVTMIAINENSDNYSDEIQEAFDYFILMECSNDKIQYHYNDFFNFIGSVDKLKNYLKEHVNGFISTGLMFDMVSDTDKIYEHMFYISYQ